MVFSARLPSLCNRGIIKPQNSQNFPQCFGKYFKISWGQQLLEGGRTEYFKTRLRAFVVKNFQVLCQENNFCASSCFCCSISENIFCSYIETKSFLGTLFPFLLFIVWCVQSNVKDWLWFKVIYFTMGAWDFWVTFLLLVMDTTKDNFSD